MKIVLQLVGYYKGKGHIILESEGSQGHTSICWGAYDAVLISKNLVLKRTVPDVVFFFVSMVEIDMGVSENSGTPKTPQNDHF